MKFTALLVASVFFSISTVRADFSLYSGVVSSESGPQKPETHAVKASDRGNCDAIDTSPELNGAAGDRAFPWPEAEFKTFDPLCGIALRFKKTGDNYDVFDDVTGTAAGSCTKGTPEQTKFCFWGLINAEYSEDYSCKSSVCA